MGKGVLGVQVPETVLLLLLSGVRTGMGVTQWRHPTRLQDRALVVRELARRQTRPPRRCSEVIPFEKSARFACRLHTYTARNWSAKLIA